MGKAIIIPDVDWSSRNLGRVTFKNNENDNEEKILEIIGDSTITSSSVYRVTLNGVLVGATWSISSTQYAQLDVVDGSQVIVTPKMSGNIVLTATYNGVSATKNITVQVVEEPKKLKIVGSTNISGISGYRCYYGDSLVEAVWSVSPAGVVAEYIDNVNKVLKLTPEQSGTIHLTAIYQDMSTGLDITVTVEIEEPDLPDSGIVTLTEKNLINQESRFYRGGNGGMLRGILYFNIRDINEWDVGLSVKDTANSKIGIQYKLIMQGDLTIDSAVTLSGGTANTTWDSGWILPGQTVNADETKNKDNSIGGASGTGKPNYIGIAYSYVTESVDALPAIEDIINNITLKITYKDE